ncbi:MAG: SurA N-terminal domain-containing protein [Victivallaceae bacterium]|nr:SurA N-terminal domain-containing protein [Victivallaceae bacterium]
MIIKRLNSMFHRHSRWLFGLFTVIIIVSFLGFLTPGRFGMEGCGSPEGRVVGEAFGRKVTIGDLQSVNRRVAVLYRMMGSAVDINIGYQDLFRMECLARMATKLGIDVNDAEVVAALKQFPPFQTEGKYDPSRYANAVKALGRSGVTETEIFDAMRMQLVQRRLEGEFTSGIIVTDGEACERYRIDNTVYSGKVFAFVPDEKKVEAKDADVAIYFEKHGDAYMTTGSVDATVAVFKTTERAAEIRKTLTDDEVKKYFEANSSAYPDGFEKSAAKVKADCVSAKALAATRRYAHGFASKCYEMMTDRPAAEQSTIFESMAKKFKVEAVRCDKLSYVADTVAKVKSPEFVKALVAASAAVPVTNEVAATDVVLVGFVRGRDLPHVADFKAVKDKVVSDYRKEVAQDKAAKAAQDCSEAIAKAADDKARAKAIADFGGKVSDIKFSKVNPDVASGLEGAAQTMSTLKKGAYSAPVPGRDGMVIVRLDAIALPDMAGFEKEKDKYIGACRMEKMQLALFRFYEELSANCRFSADFEER